MIDGSKLFKELKETKVSLREYIDLRFIELEKRLEAIDRLNQIAIDKAVTVIDERLAGMNEWRGQSKDQTATFLTKEIHSTFKDGLEQRLRPLEDSMKMIKDRASQKDVNRANLFSTASFLMALVLFILKFI